MHKNKRIKQQAKQLSIRRQIAYGLLEVVIGLVIAFVVGSWLKTLPFMQPHVARPGELDFNSGLWVLILYCFILVALMFSGFMFVYRMDKKEK